MLEILYDGSPALDCLLMVGTANFSESAEVKHYTQTKNRGLTPRVATGKIRKTKYDD